MVELAQLDTTATAADPDGSGPLTSGYDDIFREPFIVPEDTDDTTGEVIRCETFISLPAQIETRVFTQLSQLFDGANPQSAIELVFHYKDIERLGLLDPTTGICTIRNNDRLNSITDMDGNLVMEVPAGLYITEVRDSGFGFGKRRNLLVATLQDREQGTRQVQ